MGLSETPPLLLEAAGQCLFLAVQRQAFAPDAAKERAPLRLLPPPGFGLLRQAFHLAGQGRVLALHPLRDGPRAAKPLLREGELRAHGGQGGLHPLLVCDLVQPGELFLERFRPLP